MGHPQKTRTTNFRVILIQDLRTGLPKRLRATQDHALSFPSHSLRLTSTCPVLSPLPICIPIPASTLLAFSSPPTACECCSLHLRLGRSGEWEMASVWALPIQNPIGTADLGGEALCHLRANFPHSHCSELQRDVTERESFARLRGEVPILDRPVPSPLHLSNTRPAN